MADRIVQLTDKNGNRIFPYVKGSPGDAATISVGTTTTLPAGSSATVTNSGTSSAAVFNFGIPAGDKGDKGNTGNPGPANTLTIGTVQGGATADATITGTSPNQTLNLTLPKGDTGATGQDGADGFSPIANVSKVGDTATITITDKDGTTTATVSDGADGAPGSAATVSAGTTTTLPAGSSASVVNSGTSSVAVFDFSIPQGANGPANVLSIGTVVKGDNASATITGTSPSQTLNLVLPKGDKGDAGSPGAGVPIGTIIPFSGTNVPDGYLECLGQAESRTNYSELFAVIGTTYGSGDGSMTFNLPNLKGRVITGQDTSDSSFDALGETGGEKTHTLTTQELAGHQHTAEMCGITSSGSGAATQGDFYRTTYWNRFQNSGNNVHDYYGMGTLTTKSTGGNQPHNNLQPYIVVRYIIKAKDVAGVIGNIVNSYSVSENETYSASYINQLTQTQITSDLLYPVGSMYKTTVSNFNPNNVFTGTWELISSQPDRQFINSAILYGEASGSGAGTVTLVGTYQTRLISATLFNGITIPTGYHQAFRLTGEVSTGNSNSASFEINNITTNKVCTWSGTTMRQTVSSNYFKLSDITLEPCYNYTSTQGINLRLRSDASGDYRGYYPTINGYIESDDIYYTWKRIN